MPCGSAEFIVGASSGCSSGRHSDDRGNSSSRTSCAIPGMGGGVGTAGCCQCISSFRLGPDEKSIAVAACESLRFAAVSVGEAGAGARSLPWRWVGRKAECRRCSCTGSCWRRARRWRRRQRRHCIGEAAGEDEASGERESRRIVVHRPAEELPRQCCPLLLLFSLRSPLRRWKKYFRSEEKSIALKFGSSRIRNRQPPVTKVLSLHLIATNVTKSVERYLEML